MTGRFPNASQSRERITLAALVIGLVASAVLGGGSVQVHSVRMDFDLGHLLYLSGSLLTGTDPVRSLFLLHVMSAKLMAQSSKQFVTEGRLLARAKAAL